jgi:hypothetical protein
MGHVVLLGDSIFDNKVYVGDGPAVIDQMEEAVPSGWQATLCAVDGHTTREVASQFDRIPADATHLVLSLGGNDALGHTDLLGLERSSAVAMLLKFADAAESFRRRYRAVVDALLSRGLPLTVCTIYEGNMDDPTAQRVAATALCIFNDQILRVALEKGLRVLDLRLICTEPADYANPIEPSSVGGAKIVAAICEDLR